MKGSDRITVSTQDSDSCNLGSIPSRTLCFGLIFVPARHTFAETMLTLTPVHKDSCMLIKAHLELAAPRHTHTLVLHYMHNDTRVCQCPELQSSCRVSFVYAIVS